MLQSILNAKSWHERFYSPCLPPCTATPLIAFYFVEQVNTLTSKKSIEYDTHSYAPMMAGLTHLKKVARYEDHGALPRERERQRNNVLRR